MERVLSSSYLEWCRAGSTFFRKEISAIPIKRMTKNEFHSFGNRFSLILLSELLRTHSYYLRLRSLSSISFFDFGFLVDSNSRLLYRKANLLSTSLSCAFHFRSKTLYKLNGTIDLKNSTEK